MFILGIVPRYQELRREAERFAPVLADIGLPLVVYPAYRLSVEIAFTLVFVSTALLIYWHTSNHVAGLVTSVTLITLGVTMAYIPAAVTKLHPTWVWPLECIQAVGTAGSLSLFYIFPNGRFIPRWTQRLAALWVVLVLVWLVWPAAPFNHIHGQTWRNLLPFSLLFSLAWYGTGVYSQVYRYRVVATAIERQQTKWVLFGLLIAVPGVVIRDMHRLVPQVFVPFTLGGLINILLLTPLAGLLVSLVPMCITISIARFRLWDIDVIINRTLLYGALTGILALVYGGSVVLLQGLFVAVAEQQSTLAVVASTLLAAALFQPLRRRLQAIIDRHFDRRTRDLRHRADQVVHDVSAEASVPVLLDRLITGTVDLSHSTLGAIFLGEVGGKLEVGAVYNIGEEAAEHTLAGSLDLDRLKHGAYAVPPAGSHFALLLPLLGLSSDARTVLGVLALGPRRSGRPYMRAEVEVLLSVAQQAGLAIAAAQLITRGRQLEASPSGRAEAKARSLVAQPATVLAELHLLAQSAMGDQEAALVLANLPQALQQMKAPLVAQCAEGFQYLVVSQATPELLMVGLRTLCSCLARAPLEQWPEGARALATYRLAQRALDVASIAGMAALAQDLAAYTQQWQEGHNSDAARSAAHLPTIASPPTVQQHTAYLGDLARAFAALQPVAEAFHELEHTPDSDNQLAVVGQAVQRLRQVERVSTALPGLDHFIIERILQRWTVVIDAILQTVHGRADVHLSLITRQVVVRAPVILATEVTNVGKGAATNVIVELLPGAGYRVLSDPMAIAEVHPQDAFTLHFEVQVSSPDMVSPRFQVRFDDTEHAGKTQTLHADIRLLRVPATYTLIPNPYAPGKPLQPNSPVFFGRDDVFAFITALLDPPSGRNALLLTGQRRMGKTSLLKQLSSRLTMRFAPVYLDGQALGIDPGTAAFFADVARKIAEALSIPRPAPDTFSVRPGAVFEDEFLPHACAAAGDRCLLLLFDEFEELETRVTSGKLDADIFPFLRHLMQHTPQLAFIFVGTHTLHELTADYWSTFFNAALYYHVGVLDGVAARALIQQPVSAILHYDDLAVDLMLRVTGGHPYFLQLLCYTVVHDANQAQRNYVVQSHVNEGLERLLELGAAHLDDLWKACTVYERVALMALRHCVPMAGTVSVAQIVACVAEHDIDATRQSLQEAVSGLVNRDILIVQRRNEQSPDEVKYGWRLYIVALWLSQVQSWDRIKDSLSPRSPEA